MINRHLIDDRAVCTIIDQMTISVHLIIIFLQIVKNEQLLQLQKLTKREYFRKLLSVSIPSEKFFPNFSYIYQTEKGTQIQTIKQRFIYSYKIVQ